MSTNFHSQIRATRLSETTHGVTGSALVTLMRKRNRLIHAGLLGGMAGFCLVPLCEAQGLSAGVPPIRVESEQVVVPVLVLDKKRVSRMRRMDPREYLNKATSGEADLLGDLAIRGLDIRDFHLFEDGQEQQLTSSQFESESGVSSHVRDNLGDHAETVGTGGGIWTTSKNER